MPPIHRPSRVALRMRWALAALMILTLTTTLPAADRVVLVEEFTATWCQYCSEAGPLLSQLVNAYPDHFALVQIHVGDDYQTAWGANRADFYGVTGIPTTWFDGALRATNSTSYSVLLNAFNTRRAVPTDVTIDVTATPAGGQSYTFRAVVCVEPGGTAKSMRVHMAQLLDYWPASPTYHRNGFKQAAAYQDVVVSPGGCAVVERTFTFDTASWNNLEDVKVVVWAQRPNSSSPAEVFQADIVRWPFPVGDCNSNGIPDDLDISGGTSDDCNANALPDECEPDCNLNGVADECDIQGGFSDDCNLNVVPDECEPDCNLNGVADECDIQGGSSDDCNANEIPDDCETDCNGNGIPDDCDLADLVVSQPVDQYPCTGGTAVFALSAPEATGFRWYKNGLPLNDNAHFAGTHTDTLTVHNIDAGYAGDYWCVLDAGCIPEQALSDVVTLVHVTQPPSVVTQPTPLIKKCVGNTVSFTAAASGLDPSYAWYKEGEALVNDGRITGADTSNLRIADLDHADAGDYTCIVYNDCGGTESNISELQIATPLFELQPEDQCADPGETIVLSTQASSPLTIAYLWYKNGGQVSNQPGHISGAQTNTLTITNLVAGDAGEYHLMAYSTPSPLCFAESEVAIVTVGDCPQCGHPGDMDGDDDCDLADFQQFCLCFQADVGLMPECECANLDTSNAVVDLEDWGQWGTHMAGPH